MKPLGIRCQEVSELFDLFGIGGGVSNNNKVNEGQGYELGWQRVDWTHQKVAAGTGGRSTHRKVAAGRSSVSRQMASVSFER